MEVTMAETRDNQAIFRSLSSSPEVLETSANPSGMRVARHPLSQETITKEVPRAEFQRKKTANADDDENDNIRFLSGTNLYLADDSKDSDQSQWSDECSQYIVYADGEKGDIAFEDDEEGTSAPDGANDESLVDTEYPNSHMDRENDGDSDDDSDEDVSKAATTVSHWRRRIRRKERRRLRQAGLGNERRQMPLGMLVRRLRQVIIVLYSYLAICIPLWTYIYIRSVEVTAFEKEYSVLASRVIRSFDEKLSATLEAMNALSVACTSQVQDQQQNFGSDSKWPFISIRDFHRQAASTLRLSEGASVGLYPAVSSEDLKEWERYSIENRDWIGLAENNPNDTTWSDPDLFESQISPFVFNLEGDNFGLQRESGVGPYFPAWQQLPAIRNSININLAAFGHHRRGIQAALDSRSAVLSELDMFDLQTNDTAGGKAIFDYYSKLLQIKLDDPDVKYQLNPLTNIYYPIFDRFLDAGEEDTRQIKAFLVSPIFWETAFFENILPDDAGPISGVIECECKGAFTIEIDGAGATFLSHGDVHDDDFGYYERVFVFSDTGRSPTCKTSAPINPDFCAYKLKLYPSKQLRVKFITQRPLFIALAVCACLIIISAASALYDYLVQHQVKRTISSAVENRELIFSMFPKQIRERLYGIEGEDDESKAVVFTRRKASLNDTVTWGHPKAQLQKMMSGSIRNIQAKQRNVHQFSHEPIADLFLKCTVLFSAIDGFLDWSFDRTPEQVFVLLEAVFAIMDRIAKRRKVFKVETIGDNFVAVTGIPSPQEDHALRMARFARECLDTVNKLFADLSMSATDTLGGRRDVGQLCLKFGLHSGPVTAGVLGGRDNTRFQLFGDTMNTASRIMNSCAPDHLQISESTAELLLTAGKEKWIVPREDKLMLKGKGLTPSHWLLRRSLTVQATPILEQMKRPDYQAQLAMSTRSFQPDDEETVLA